MIVSITKKGKPRVDDKRVTSGITVTPHRVLAEGDSVVMHSTYDNAQAFGADRLVGIDVFRVANGKLAKHWDNLQPPAPLNPSVRSMTGGPTEVTDHAQTVQNKTLSFGFVADVLHGASPEKITDDIPPTRYLLHNPQGADGLAGLKAALTAMAEAELAMTYTDTPIIVAEGNFVSTASEGTIGDSPTAFIDLFRIEDGKIVEHWDTISKIPTEMAHNNGTF